MAKKPIEAHKGAETNDVKKVKDVTATEEIGRTFTRHAGPREVIERVKYKLYPIESGVVKFFNPKTMRGFVTPNDGGKDIYVEDTERTFKDGEAVNYININNEALVTSKGQIKIKSEHANKIVIIVTPEDTDKKDVDLFMKPTFPHNKVEGHANVADKSSPEYLVDTSSLSEGDQVDFIANEKGTIVAIQKK